MNAPCAKCALMTMSLADCEDFDQPASSIPSPSAVQYSALIGTSMMESSSLFPHKRMASSLDQQKWRSCLYPRHHHAMEEDREKEYSFLVSRAVTQRLDDDDLSDSEMLDKKMSRRKDVAVDTGNERENEGEGEEEEEWILRDRIFSRKRIRMRVEGDLGRNWSTFLDDVRTKRSRQHSSVEQHSHASDSTSMLLQPTVYTPPPPPLSPPPLPPEEAVHRAGLAIYNLKAMQQNWSTLGGENQRLGQQGKVSRSGDDDGAAYWSRREIEDLLTFMF
ncbi:unnamed protein product [Periconia digitata]|uniref:Uncharacterized protein n=1 Tax=Periconia digitata TaxID=1303443 RepID=A0A9W4XUD8_9PLEO|nr:unnamed protein product [Periconia digitata]